MNRGTGQDGKFCNFFERFLTNYLICDKTHYHIFLGGLEWGGADPFQRGADLGLALASGVILPPVIARAGERATERLIEFFTAHIHNPNTHHAYGRVA